MAVKRILLATVVLLGLAGLTRADGPAPRYPEHLHLSYYLDAAGQKHRIETPADWEIRRQHVLYWMQQVMGKFPADDQRVPLAVKVEEETGLDGGIVRKKVTYQSAADHRVAAYLFLPAGNEKRPAMLCLHPTGAPGKKIVAGLEGKANRAYAIELAKRGYVTIAPDYPTFGDYKIENPSAEPWHSGSMRAIWDNVLAIDLLQSLPQVDGGRIGAIGHSLGGHNAMFTAVFEPRIKAVVSSCGWTRFHKYKGGNLAGWTSSRYMPTIASEFHNSPDEVPFDFTEIIAAIAPRAFFTSSPLHDDNFDIGGVKEGLESARPIYRLLEAEKNLVAIHPDCPHDFPDEARERAYVFLDKTIGAR